MRPITRIIWILSLVSLFTDLASEMLYPVMPIFLKSIGFSVLLIGVLEGIAEVTAGWSKGYFGKLSDRSGKRLPFVQWGYFLSAISKPMMAIWSYPIWIFFARTTDRFGKGMRTGARDAMLSDEATPQTKGTVFGFHRSMDTLGAVGGPLLALLFLYFFPEEYKLLFLIAFFPGLIAVLFTFFLKEKKNTLQYSESAVNPILISFQYWKTSSLAYKKLIVGLLIFTLFNSSDIFLLLKIKEAGFNDTTVIVVYIFYNLVYALFAFPIGKLADKIGLKNIFIFGLLLFALVYFGMGVNENKIVFFVLFFLYGIYAASTEGIVKAWISNICEKKDTAIAIGAFTGFQSIGVFFASSLAGLIWIQFGAMTTFMLTGIVTVGVLIYFLAVVELPKT